jgi:hypothetical protein
MVQTGRGDFHLSKSAARELVEKAISSYTERVGQPPSELFLHGKVRFNDEEWSVVSGEVQGATPILWAFAFVEIAFLTVSSERIPCAQGPCLRSRSKDAYLWTKGFVPRLQTYPGREVPWPLMVEVSEAKLN